jgi:hypothetical protein
MFLDKLYKCHVATGNMFQLALYQVDDFF